MHLGVGLGLEHQVLVSVFNNISSIVIVSNQNNENAE